MKCQKDELECAVRQGCGIVNDLRYFLKPDATDNRMSKVACRKMRCCSIDKHHIDKEVLDNIIASEYDHIIRNDHIFTVPYNTITFVVTKKRQQCTGDRLSVEKQPSKEDDKDHDEDDGQPSEKEDVEASNEMHGNGLRNEHM